MTMKEQDAMPKYDRGSRVKYTDRDERTQFGNIRSIKADWPGYMQCGDDCLIFYRITHPTYRNEETAVSEDKIIEEIPSDE